MLDRLPFYPACHILSFLGPNDLYSFICCCKQNYKIYDKNRLNIEFPFFMRAIAKDPSTWLLMEKEAKTESLKRALIAWIGEGIVLKQNENEFPILKNRELIDKYKEILRVNKNVKRSICNVWRIKKTDSFKELVRFEKFMVLSFNNEINIIDLKKRKINILEKGFTPIYFLKMDEATRRIYAGVGREIKCWEIDSGKCLKKLKGAPTCPNAIDAEGDILYLGNYNKIEIWNLKEETLCKKLEHSEDWVCHIQKAGSNVFALTATELLIWNSETGEFLSKIGKVDGSNFKVFRDLLFVCKEQKVAIYHLLDIQNPQQLAEISCQFDENYKVHLIGNLFFIISHRIAGNMTEIWNIADVHQGKVTLLHRLYHSENLMSGLVEHCHVAYDLRKGGWFELWQYDLPFLSYSQKQLQSGFHILAAMAEHAGKKRWKECGQLSNELDREFKKRLELHFGVQPSFSKVSKQDISHVAIEICIDVMLYAVYEENWTKMAPLLKVLENNNKNFSRMLYELLSKECGKKKDSDWGKNALHRTSGYSAPKHRIIAAIFCLQEKLYKMMRSR